MSPNLQINEDLDFQRRWWEWERGSWIIGLLIIACALVGWTGDGPLARTTRGTASGHLQLTYPKIARRLAPQQIIVFVKNFPPEGHLTFRVSQSLSKNLELLGAAPAPVSTASDVNSIEVAFLPVQGQAAMQITFDVEPRNAGVLRGTIEYAGETLELSQLVLP